MVRLTFPLSWLLPRYTTIRHTSLASPVKSSSRESNPSDTLLSSAAKELRRRREEAQVEIRKQKREESVAKRRNFNAPSSGADSDEEGGADSSVRFIALGLPSSPVC